MRILYSFPYPIGAPGVGTTAMQQVKGLLDRGHDLTVIATSVAPGCLAFPKVIETLRFVGVRVPHRLLGIDRTRAYHDIHVSRHLRGRPGRYDVVHCWPGATIRTAEAADEIGIPTLREVPNTHIANAYEVTGKLFAELDFEAPRTSPNYWNPKRLATETAEYEKAFRILTPSEHVRETFLARGVAPERLLRHRYGFDPARFPPGPPRKDGGLRALFLGLIGPRKGLHFGLEAWRRSEASKTGRFTIYGRVEKGYERIIAEYMNMPSVEIRSFTSNVSQALQQSDVLVLPSIEEGSALVTYEAQGSGVVPLVSEQSGAMCTDGLTGLVHQAGDVAALTAHLDRVNGDPAYLARMREAVLHHRDELTWAAAAQRLEQCYESALADFARR